MTNVLIFLEHELICGSDVHPFSEQMFSQHGMMKIEMNRNGRCSLNTTAQMEIEMEDMILVLRHYPGGY